MRNLIADHGRRRLVGDHCDREILNDRYSGDAIVVRCPFYCRLRQSRIEVRTLFERLGISHDCRALYILVIVAVFKYRSANAACIHLPGLLSNVKKKKKR